ncbi:MAG TPA: hypothetical protein VHA75_19940 [Rugosimonospora sp.]|nr:hypothetical protein [Rugosimonospora sp.]
MIARDEAERVLVGLTAAHDRIAAGVFAIDQHPALNLLRGSTLSGATAERARALLPEVDRLWAYFTLFGTVLDQVRAILAGRRLDDGQRAELDALLRQPILGLDAAGMPVDGSAPAASQITVTELTRQLEHRVTTVTGHLAEVDAAWTAIAGRIAPLTERVDAAATLATDLGEVALAERLRAELAEVSRVELADPLSAAPGGRATGLSSASANLSSEVDEAQRQLRRLALVRDEYPQRVAALGTLLDQLGDAEAAVVAAQARAAEKIADPGLAAPVTANPILRTRLAGLDQLRHDREWVRLADELSTVEDAVRQAIARAGEQRAVADGLIERRDELRGRLTAYRAKAGQQGFAEDDTLGGLYQRAERLLYTAPCDLRAATRAVYEYQQALNTVVQAVRSDTPTQGGNP